MTLQYQADSLWHNSCLVHFPRTYKQPPAAQAPKATLCKFQAPKTSSPSSLCNCLLTKQPFLNKAVLLLSPALYSLCKFQAPRTSSPSPLCNCNLSSPSTKHVQPQATQARQSISRHCLSPPSLAPLTSSFRKGIALIPYLTERNALLRRVALRKTATQLHAYN